MLRHQAVEDRVDIRGLVDRAIEVGGQPVDASPRSAICPTLTQPVVVPREVVAAQLDLQALQAVAANPVAQEDRIAVVGLGAGQLVRRRSGPCRRSGARPGWSRPEPGQELLGISPGERHVGARGRREEMGEVVVHIAERCTSRRSARRGARRRRRAAPGRRETQQTSAASRGTASAPGSFGRD